MDVFSDREQKIIKIIGRKKVTLGIIDKELFDENDKPMDSIIAVANSVRRIIRKCVYNNLPWTLEKTKDKKTLLIKKVKSHA